MKYKGIDIHIRHDEGLNPRTDFDNGNTMVCFHRRYDLGDKHDYVQEDYKSWDELRDAIIKKEKPIAILPLFLYDHSGITMSTTTEYPYNCQWDSMQVGFIFVNEEGCEQMGWSKSWAKKMSEGDNEKYKGKTREQILTDFLVSDVKTYDQYLTGEVYLFEIEETGDCVGGFFGDDFEENGLLEHARSEIDYYLKDKMKTRLKKLKQYITSKVPIIYRELPEVA